MRLLIAARNGRVGVEGGHIVAAQGTFDRVIEAPHADIRPGLINAHDHLHRNHYGRLGRPPYANAYEWARDIQARHRDHIAQGRRLPRREALLAGAWKNLRAGVTSVVHHDRWEEDFDRDFPLRVIPLTQADSLGMTPDFPLPPAGPPFALHLAEGIDASAADEVDLLDRRGLLGPGLIAVHGLGMDATAIARFRASGAALVWCPGSNLFLFGRTIPPALATPGQDILLGSDSLLTGSGDLLDELRLARSTGLLSDTRLEESVGALAARRLGLRPPVLTTGERADLILLGRPLLEAHATDVRLVMVGGVIRILGKEFAAGLNHDAADGLSEASIREVVD
jgi:cytosine/adenosine deaminase-related metal-dependent hydrolase